MGSCCQVREKKKSDDSEKLIEEVQITNKDVVNILIKSKLDDTMTQQNKFFNSNTSNSINDKIYEKDDPYSINFTFQNIETDKNQFKRDSTINTKEIHLAENESITNMSFQRKDYDTLNNKYETVGSFEIVINIMSFVVVGQEFSHIFRVDLDPQLYIFFNEKGLEYEFSKINDPDPNNKIKTFTNNEKEKKFIIKKDIKNDNSNIIFSLSHKNEKSDETIEFLIGEAVIPINIFLNKISNQNDKSLCIPIFCHLESLLIGNLTLEFMFTSDFSNENLKNSKNEGFKSFQRDKFDNYLKNQIPNYFDIDRNLRNQLFKDYENLHQKSFNNIEFLINNEESIFEIYQEISEPNKNLLLEGKFDELRKNVMVPNTSKYDHLEIYVLLYNLIEMINNKTSEKLNSDLFYQTFLYQILDNKNNELNNIVLFDILLRFYIKLKEKNLVKAELKYHLINLEKFMNSTKSVFDSIVNYLRLSYQDSKLKRLCNSDPNYNYFKSTLNNIFILLKLLLKDDYDFDKVNSNNEDKSKQTKSKSKFDENILRIVEKDINWFKKNYKEMLIINDELLLSDSNIIFSITKCLSAYLKLAKKYSKLKNISRVATIYDVFLNDCEIVTWLKTVLNKFKNNKKFFVELLEISNELLDDCLIFSYVSNFLSIFNSFLIIKSFSGYKDKLSSENLKLWMFYLSIISKISFLTQLDKNQFIEKSHLSNREVYMIVYELIDISSIFEENKIFTTNNNNTKFLEIQICLQIQLSVLEAIKNLLKNMYVIKAFLLVKNQKIIIFMKRLIYLFFYDKTKIKNENSSLFGTITFNCFFIIYYILKDEELLNNFFKQNINIICDYDFIQFKEKLLEEILYYKSNSNSLKITKYDKIFEELKKL